MKKVSKLIFSLIELEWFESIYCVASFGILVADKTIIRRGKNNAQAKTWKLTLHQNAQRKIIVFTRRRSSRRKDPTSCLFEDTEQ